MPQTMTQPMREDTPMLFKDSRAGEAFVTLPDDATFSLALAPQLRASHSTAEE